MKNVTVRSAFTKVAALGVGISAVAVGVLPAMAAPHWNDQPRFEQMKDNRDRRDLRTLEGIVTNDLRGNAFRMRPFHSDEVRVQVRGGEPRRVSRGDRVRVTGFYRDGVFHTDYVNILHNR